MKKRLLALALCLVMMTSLLPLTAAADSPSTSVMYSWVGGITPGGIYCGDIYITDASPEGFQIVDVIGVGDSVSYPAGPLGDGRWELPASDEINTVSVVFYDTSTERNQALLFPITSNYSHTWSAWTSNGDGTHSRTCGNGCVDSPQTEFCADNDGDHLCDDCGASVHTWSYEVSRAGDSLTATCNPGCTIGEVTVKLNAHSVTLPDSPFNAQLAGKEQFETATGAVISKIRYDYRGSDGVWHKDVDPVPANAKAGEYQAFVEISNLPGTVVDESGNPLNQAYLYVKYTAVDPAVTAQTGDNRPIELMLGSVVVFSALAAAAFILDNKRKYSR